MCSKALLGEAQPVTEYTIAVDVFGKSPDFKESKDSSVRVEVYRLRKRLTQFYQAEGAGRPLRILLPPGRYTPQFQVAEFTIAEEEIAPAAEPDLGTVCDPADPVLPAPDAVFPPAPASQQPLIRSFKAWAWLFVLALLIVLMAAVALRRTQRQTAAGTRSTPPLKEAKPARLAPLAAFSPARMPLRIMAGYQGPPHTDSSGAVWGSDRYFHSGHTWHQSEMITARTNDSLLFQQWRSGEFSYDIPLNPGVYEMHLYLVQSESGPQAGRGENDDTFSVAMNGQEILPGMDIASDAMGTNIADERVFKDVSPAGDGMLHLVFAGTRGIPVINALKLLPGTAHRQLPIRLVAQPTSFTDHLGQTWEPDNYYLNGQTVNRGLSTAGTPDPGLFAVERYGHFTYAIPVDRRGRYTITLHFAELYFGPDQPGHGGAGSRVFNVMCNGVFLLENFDIFREVGSSRALTKTFHHIKPTAQGKINLTFEPVANYGMISAIEVLDESQ